LVIWQASGLPLGTFRNPGPAYIPIGLALLLLILGFSLAATSGGTAKWSSIEWTEWRHAAAILIGCLVAVVGIERLGYRLTVLVISLFLLRSIERRGWLLSVTLSCALAFGSFLLFHTLLRVPLPQGPFAF
jgi:hypothetical protein